MPRRDLIESLLSPLLQPFSTQTGVTTTSSSSLSESSSRLSTPPSTPTTSPTTSRPDIASSNTADAASTPSPTLPQSSTSPHSVLTEISFSLTTVVETSPAPTTTRTSNDPTASSSSILSTSPASPLPALPPSPSTSQSHSGTGADVGIAIAVSVVAVCLVLASLLYLKRRRNRALMAVAHPFITGPSRHWAPNSHSTRGARRPLYSADSSRDRSVLEARGKVTARENSSFFAQVSPVDSSTLDHPTHVSHPYPGARGVDRPVTSEKLFWGPRDRPISTSDGSSELTEAMAEVSPAPDFYGYPAIVYRGEPRRETDGGVRLGGGRRGENSAGYDCDHESASDASILPPSYSSDFGEA